MNKRYLPEGERLHSMENREATSSIISLEKAKERGTILEGVAVLCDNRMDLYVDVGGFRGVIPREEVVYNPDGSPVRDIAIISRVGKPVCFCILEIESPESGRDSVLLHLSRRIAQRECADKYLAALLPGDIIPARVTHLERFGAFADIGCGLIALLSIDCMSVSRINHPSERLYPGMEIRTVVKSIDPVLRRVNLSMRELLGTWTENAANFSVGQTVTGYIRSVESYGVFIELAPNLAGLTELRDETRRQAEEWVGQCAAVFIKSILPERMKIKLILIDTYRSAPDKPLTYYIPPEVTHLDRWVYSPDCCSRKIETVF